MKSHTFTIEVAEEDQPIVSLSIKEGTLLDAIGAFENFLYAAGYRFPKGCSLGYEYDEEARN